MTIRDQIKEEIKQQEEIQTMSKSINSYEINHIVNKSIYNEVKLNIQRLYELKAIDGKIIINNNKRIWTLTLPGPSNGLLHIYEKEQAYLNKLNISKSQAYINDEATYKLQYKTNHFHCENGWELEYIGKGKNSFLSLDVEKSITSKFGAHKIYTVKVHPSKTLQRYMDLFKIKAGKEEINVKFYPQLLVEHKITFANNQRKFIKLDQFDTWYSCKQDMISEIVNIYVKMEINIDLS